jgi:hypothetical protein
MEQHYPPGTQEDDNSFSSRNLIMGKGKELEFPEGRGGGKGQQRSPGVPPKEVQVYSFTDFDTEKYYFFAQKTKTVGFWPNEKHYTTNPLQYVGRYVRTVHSGGIWGDGRSSTYIFDNNGEEVSIEPDYHGRTCFIEDAQDSTLEVNEPEGVVSPIQPKKDPKHSNMFWNIVIKYALRFGIRFQQGT